MLIGNHPRLDLRSDRCRKFCAKRTDEDRDHDRDEDFRDEDRDKDRDEDASTLNLEKSERACELQGPDFFESTAC